MNDRYIFIKNSLTSIIETG